MGSVGRGEDEAGRNTALPETVPIFPLTGVLLLPGGRLPLNIFEPRYLAMTRDAMQGERLIGMIQPTDSEADEPPPVYRIGCAGRITSYSETGDGRILITLTGLSRFVVKRELPVLRGYRRVSVDWTPFAADLAPPPAAGAPGGLSPIDRPRLVAALKAFFKLHEISADWDAIRGTPDERLVTSLAMICPFAPSEKQALLEAADLAERSHVMTALIEMAVMDGSGDGDNAAPKH